MVDSNTKLVDDFAPAKNNDLTVNYLARSYFILLKCTVGFNSSIKNVFQETASVAEHLKTLSFGDFEVLCRVV